MVTLTFDNGDHRVPIGVAERVADSAGDPAGIAEGGVTDHYTLQVR